MPEKPKRRKNNKNKRKNKNNISRPDTSKSSSSEVNESTLKDSGSDTNLEQSENTEKSFIDNSVDEVKPSVDSFPCEIQSNLTNECNEFLQQDLNNNSESVINTCDTVVTNENVDPKNCETYLVESPEQSLKTKPKLNGKVKSKSLDNEDDTKIVEITDESGSQCENDTTMEIIDSNILVTDVDSDIEWEKIEDSASDAKELVTGTLSVATIPLNIAQCEHTKSLTPDQETSLRHYLQSLNLSTNANMNSIEIKTEIEQIINREIRHRLRKKGLADDFIPTRLGPPRILDVIDEEGSSESSLTSRRHSYLSDKKSDNEDLEDDVFEENPKISKNSSLRPKAIGRLHKNLGPLVPQECFLVGAKLKEPEVAEARGDWTMQTVEKMKGAEIVYLTDSSSSTSSIHEIGEETDNGEETDVSVRMITPTIEVTDTDSFLKKTFISENNASRHEMNTIEFSNNLKSDKNINIATDNYNTQEFDNTNSENNHVIIVSSIDNIKTNLYVKDIDEADKNDDNETEYNLSSSTVHKTGHSNKDNDVYDLEMKVLKCELNNAINNLIKEVSSDSESNETPKENFIRQDSSSSIGSSQCTAKYNPTYSSLNDVSNMHDEITEGLKISADNNRDNSTSSHVKDVIECVTGISAHTRNRNNQPPALRDICVQKIASLPYGEKILEELASVSEKLQSINSSAINTCLRTSTESTAKNMPYYPLPDLSTIERVSLPVQQKEPIPPPVQPRNSSLKKSQDDHHWTGVPTKMEPVYICLSPSQKMLMEKTNTILTKENASQLVDMHKKYVDRRGYNEPSNDENKYNNQIIKDPPIVPFKSQTGSRLLALIRDPTVTSHIHTSTSSRYNYNTEQLKKGYMSSEFISKLRDEGRKISDYAGTFKPIPPPRPKKYSSSYYESDESSDFTDNSLRSFKNEKKVFHYSTGNLSKDIEDDISSIQNMHRYYTNIRDNSADYNRPRRPSLPKDLCDQQMEYIRQKEKEVEAEIKRLEQEKFNMSSQSITIKKGPRAPLIADNILVTEKNTYDNVEAFKKKDNFTSHIQSSEKSNRSKLSSLFSSSQEELLRDKMYSEYVTQMAERQERKQHKVIKITNPTLTTNNKTVSKSMSALDILDSKVNNRIEKEFISKARERWTKLGITDPETEDEVDKDKDVYREPKVIEHKIKVIEAGQERDVKKLPTHLQEFVSFTAKQKEKGSESSGESDARPASPHVVIWCAVMIIVLAVGKYFLRLLRNK